MKNIKACFILIMILLLSPLKNVIADGFIVIPRQDVIPATSSPFLLEVKYHHVNIDINDLASTTYIDQEFYNPTSYRIEGDYIFPIPKNAVIKKFSMYINGKETQAELLSAKKAKKIYEDIVRRMKDPALLEYQELSLFRARVYPIEPHSKKRIKISYTEILKKDNGTIEYVYPLNTEKFSSAPLKSTIINVNLKTKNKLKNIYCPTHNAEIVRKSEKKAVISYEENNTKPDRDFKVYYNTDKSKMGVSLLTYKEEGKSGYYFLSAAPSFDLKQNEIEEKDITFVLDTSGSMAGEKMKQAKKSLLFCVNNLNRGDRFQIVRFSTEAEALFRTLIKVDERTLKSAGRFINNLQAIGGTNIEEALQLALASKKNKKRPHIVVFITDGKPTIGETKEKSLLDLIKKANNSNTRIFTFGIGNDINIHLLDKITEMTKAYRSYIAPDEDIEIKISNFYQKIQSPVLTDVSIKVIGKVKTLRTYPKKLSDLFKGSSIVVLGRYSGSGKATVQLRGKIRGKDVKYKYKLSFHKDDDKNDFIPPLWAARSIGYLLDQIRLHGEDKELVDEVTKLARDYGIITPYTSYLIVEDEKTRVTRRELDDNFQTLGASIPESAPVLKKNKEEYKHMKLKSGKGSVQASEELQIMNKADNIGKVNQGKSRLNYRDKTGRMRNIVQQVKQVQGRAVYNSGNIWVDSRIQKKRKHTIVKIQFASKKYFKFLDKNPKAAQFLSLGMNVKFQMKNKVYEIYE